MTSFGRWQIRSWDIARMYEIVFHRDFVKDLKKISPDVVKQIRKAITQKLTFRPNDFKFLTGKMVGLQRLRVGDYRIIYNVQGERVNVLAVGHRSKIYYIKE